MTGEYRYQLIDTAGSELEIVTDPRSQIDEGDSIELSDGSQVSVVEAYADEAGREGGVHATLVVD